MEKLPKGTLSEQLNGATNTTIPKEATIRIVEPTVLPDKPAPAPVPTVVEEPTAPNPSQKPNQDKEPCTLCKAKSIANVAFSFSLVLLVLAFSFSLVKADK